MRSTLWCLGLLCALQGSVRAEGFSFTVGKNLEADRYVAAPKGRAVYGRVVGGLNLPLLWKLGAGTQVKSFLRFDPQLFYWDKEAYQEGRYLLRTKHFDRDGGEFAAISSHAVRRITDVLEPGNWTKPATARWTELRAKVFALLRQGAPDQVLATAWIPRERDKLHFGEYGLLNFKTIYCEGVDTRLSLRKGEVVFEARPLLIDTYFSGGTVRARDWGDWVKIASYKPGRRAKELFLPAGLEKLLYLDDAVMENLGRPAPVTTASAK